MVPGNNLKTKSRVKGLLFSVLVLFGGAIVMLADQQAERIKFLEYSDLVYQGIAQRLLTAEGAITALVNFDHDSTIDENIADEVAIAHKEKPPVKTGGFHISRIKCVEREYS